MLLTLGTHKGGSMLGVGRAGESLLGSGACNQAFTGPRLTERPSEAGTGAGSRTLLCSAPQFPSWFKQHFRDPWMKRTGTEVGKPLLRPGLRIAGQDQHLLKPGSRYCKNRLQEKSGARR